MRDRHRVRIGMRLRWSSHCHQMSRQGNEIGTSIDCRSPAFHCRETAWECRPTNRTLLLTQFEKIIRRAGVEAWPRLWQNLRSSRETELCEQHPLHVVCQWIGNTERIAAPHYLQVRDEDFEKAISPL